MAAKIKKGDVVQVVSGKEKGKRGTVLSVHPSENRVVVEGVNVQKRHVKANVRPSMPQGGVLERPGKIHISNVKLYSEALGRPVRVGFGLDDKGQKVRVVRGREGGGTVLD